MALRLTLKPHERLILGGTVVRNGASRTELIIENEVPILRERDILRPRDATTPCRRIYLALQLMYVEPQDLAAHQALYFELARDVVRAAPSTLKFIAPMNDDVAAGRYYQALKTARQLIDYEEELFAHGRQCA